MAFTSRSNHKRLISVYKCAVPTLVAVHALGTVALVAAVDTGRHSVDRDLVIVGSKTMSVGIRVREQPTLEEKEKITQTEKTS